MINPYKRIKELEEEAASNHRLVERMCNQSLLNEIKHLDKETSLQYELYLSNHEIETLKKYKHHSINEIGQLDRIIAGQKQQIQHLQTPVIMYEDLPIEIPHELTTTETVLTLSIVVNIILACILIF